MYSGAFLRSSSGVFIGFKSWNRSHSLKFGIFLATSYDFSHSDTVLFRIFTGKATNYINAYVCIMHMVNAMRTAGINGDWLTLLSPLSDFQDLILEMKGVIPSHRFTLYTVA